MSTHPIRTLSHSAEEIAALTGTSVAAVNRFARAAGFEGFAHLKTTLGEELQSTVAPLGKLRPAGRPAKSKPPAPAGDGGQQRGVAGPGLQRAAGRLLKARQVLLLGLGTSTYLAGYAAHVLTPYLAHVWTVAGEGGTEEAARRLARCGRGDVLVAI